MLIVHELPDAPELARKALAAAVFNFAGGAACTYLGLLSPHNYGSIAVATIAFGSLVVAGRAAAPGPPPPEVTGPRLTRVPLSMGLMCAEPLGYLCAEPAPGPD